MPTITLRTFACIASMILSLASARSAYAACDGDTSAVGPTTIDVGGVSRLFVVRKASGVDGRTAAPVVMVFHPYGMTAQYMEGRVSTRLWPGALMVYPEGATGPSRGYARSW